MSSPLLLVLIFSLHYQVSGNTCVVLSGGGQILGRCSFSGLKSCSPERNGHCGMVPTLPREVYFLLLRQKAPCYGYSATQSPQRLAMENLKINVDPWGINCYLKPSEVG
ncbi:hypothetical protein NPIL_468061 [Nephila pilipes]|uniref:Uncharacterized protein n=1 Tax=Nephila pilipes TaxID=299642 RepID=A0A8X6NW86_NEPPI|nr:hypothetical protein NPIL_468061 [Nephila pilipes]